MEWQQGSGSCNCRTGSGMYFVVVAADEHYGPLLQAAKDRTLHAPKRKNIKHVQLNNRVIALTSWNR